MVCYWLTVQIQITDWIWVLGQGNFTVFIRSQEKKNVVSSKKLPCEVISQGDVLLPTISARDISVWIFHHQDILASACFGPADIPAHGHFVSKDIVTQESWVRLCRPLTQANGRLIFEDDLRSGRLLGFTIQWTSICTGLDDSMVTMGEPEDG